PAARAPPAAALRRVRARTGAALGSLGGDGPAARRDYDGLGAGNRLLRRLHLLLPALPARRGAITRPAARYRHTPMRTPPATMSPAASTSLGPTPSARFRTSADQTTAHSDSVA